MSFCDTQTPFLSLSAVGLPVFIFTALLVSVARSVLGPQGAFPSWNFMMALSFFNGCIFYGLFNATYPFSFFLQIQVYSVFTIFGVCAYTAVAFLLQCVPAVGGEFNTFFGWLFALAANIVALTHMSDVFGYLGYPLSRTVGNPLWHPWVAFVLVILFLSLGAVESAANMGRNARFFEPDRESNEKAV